jgi:cysteine desulfurase
VPRAPGGGARSSLARHRKIDGRGPGIVFNAPLAQSLPTTINFSVPDVASATLLDLFDAAGMRVSAGSACSAGKAGSSYVLDAMGVPAWRSAAAVRLSFGALLDDALLDLACERIARCGAALATPMPVAGAEPAIDGAIDSAMLVPADAARGWLATHPDAIVIDVRDLREHSVAGAGVGTVSLHGRAVRNVPLACVADQAPQWLGATTPLLFVCRSGARSARAAQALRAMGHPGAWSLVGGFALAI